MGVCARVCLCVHARVCVCVRTCPPMHVCMYGVCVRIYANSDGLYIMGFHCIRPKSSGNSPEPVRVEKPSYTDNKQLQQLQELLKQRDDEISTL